MPASKTGALDFVDSAFKPKTSLRASRLSVIKGSYLAPKALLQIQPWDLETADYSTLDEAPFQRFAC